MRGWVRFMPLALMGMGVGLAGCGGLPAEEAALSALGPGRPIVATSVQWMGGYANWRAVRGVRALALVTAYENGGPAYTNMESLTIDLAGGTISAAAGTGQGAWAATTRRAGRCELRGNGFRPTEQMEGQVCDGLRTILERSAGPLNLLRRPPEVRAVEPARFGGQDLVRLIVRESPSQDVSYYFAPVTGELRFVVTEPRGATGTVTRYTWQMLPVGLAFPLRIQVTQAGQAAPIGETPLLDVQFQRVRIEQDPWR